MQVWYSVSAKFSDIAVRDEYLAWLSGGHIQAVVSGGAVNAKVIVLDADGLTVLTQYLFPSLQAFDRYVEIHAPALRADGQKRFPPERGVTFARLQGNVAASAGQGP